MLLDLVSFNSLLEVFQELISPLSEIIGEARIPKLKNE
jgi:hypothetical protein